MKIPTVSFPKNIYHYCQRNFVDRDLLDVSFKTAERRLGALPYDWLKNHKPKKYAEITKKVDKLFREFAVSRAPWAKAGDYFEAFYRDFKFVKKLSKILKRDDIKIEYVDNGSYKYCHKLTVGKYKYALLNFIREFAPLKQLEIDTLRGSGAFVEPCRIFDFYKEYSHGRVVKPFMTRFVNDTNVENYDAYMLVKFVDKKDKSMHRSSLPEYQKRFYKYKMNDHTLGNMINGIIVDIGKITEGDEVMESSELRQDLFAFYGLLVNNHYENFANPILKKYNFNQAQQIKNAINNAEEFLYSLMEDGYDIYNIDIRPFIKDLPELEQKFVIKKTRALKKVHKLKLKFQQNREYEYYYKTEIENYAREYCSWTMKRELL